MIQFRLPGRQRDNVYGDSILWPFRRLYKTLVRTEDAVMNYRWQRSPDRLLWKIDVTGVPWAEHFGYVQMWRQWMHKLIASGQRQSTISSADPFGNPRHIESQWKYWAPHLDLYMPVSANKNNDVTTLGGGNDPGRIFDLIYLRENAALSLGSPRYSFNLDADPQPGKKLSHSVALPLLKG